MLFVSTTRIPGIQHLHESWTHCKYLSYSRTHRWGLIDTYPPRMPTACHSSLCPCGEPIQTAEHVHCPRLVATHRMTDDRKHPSTTHPKPRPPIWALQPVHPSNHESRTVEPRAFGLADRVRVKRPEVVHVFVIINGCVGSYVHEPPTAESELMTLTDPKLYTERSKAKKVDPGEYCKTSRPSGPSHF